MKLQKGIVLGERKLALRVACATALVALFACSADGTDVFSDAATFRRGFIDANDNGLFTTGKAELPDALKGGDAGNAAHQAIVKGCSTGIVLRTETVCYPYANVCREETVAYFPQTVFKKEGQEKDYLISSVVNLTDASPFAVTNANQYTYFLRYRWDGTRTTNSYAGVFLNAGWVYGKSYVEGDPMTGGAGFLLGINGAGNFWLYPGYGRGNTTFSSTPSGYAVLSNEWTDCAIVVSNSQLTVYTYRTNFPNIYVSPAKSLVYAAATNYSTTLFLGGQSATSSDAGQALSGSGNEWKVFRGSIHTFAAWPRALTLDEVKQVFAWPRMDLVRLGTANGSSLEFGGGASAAVTAGTPTEWADTPAALTSETPSFDVAFDIPDYHAGMGQVLRVIPTAASESGTLQVSVNGTAAGSLPVRPGKAGALYIPGARFVLGSNTLQLTRTSTSGTIRFDAIALGGGFLIGREDNAGGEFVQEQEQWKDYYALDGKGKHANRSIMAPTGPKASTNRIHYIMPSELVPRYPLRFTARVRPSAGDYASTRTYPEMQDLAIYVNRSSTPALAGQYSRLKGWTNLVVEVAAEDVLPGENVFSIVNETQKWWDDDFRDYAWTSIDCFRVEVLPAANGTMILLR